MCNVETVAFGCPWVADPMLLIHLSAAEAPSIAIIISPCRNAADLGADSFLPIVVPVKLGAVPTSRHIAPAAAVTLARVQEEPLAAFREACAHKGQLLRRQQIDSRTRNRPQHAIELAQLVEFPFEAVSCRHQMHMPRRRLRIGIEPRKRSRRNRPLVDDRPEDVVDRFAQFPAPGQNLLRTLRLNSAAFAQSIHLDGIEHSRIFGEARQIRIRLQQFFWIRIAVVESVHEIEAHVPRNQIETRRTAPNIFRGLLSIVSRCQSLPSRNII